MEFSVIVEPRDFKTAVPEIIENKEKKGNLSTLFFREKRDSLTLQKYYTYGLELRQACSFHRFEIRKIGFAKINSRGDYVVPESAIEKSPDSELLDL
ncbi:hypothetical protein TNCV_3893511 [Trichonephila clavipes]|nr:hypothetical protein TNCV_3893511 [Trichonephila clavipes]